MKDTHTVHSDPQPPLDSDRLNTIRMHFPSEREQDLLSHIAWLSARLEQAEEEIGRLRKLVFLFPAARPTEKD